RYFNNSEQCEVPSRKPRTASFLRGSQCGDGSGRRHICPSWPKVILCLSAIQWHASETGSHTEKVTNGEPEMMSGVSNVVNLTWSAPSLRFWIVVGQ
uniref:Fibronectin type-III domain-containing protein n=1 Tax=Mesocestoides corti TaxID=53468 RepID=A0A5K3EZW0_MESCO